MSEGMVTCKFNPIQSIVCKARDPRD